MTHVWFIFTDTSIQSKATSPSSSDFTPLKLACYNKETRKSQEREITPSKPPVPVRSKKLVLKDNQKLLTSVEKTNPNYEKTAATNNVLNISAPKSAQEKTLAPPPRLIPIKVNCNSSGSSSTSSVTTVKPLPSSSAEVSSNDILLAPPPEFQESVNDPVLALASQHPSYGDYELLSQDVQYNCATQPISTARTNALLAEQNNNQKNNFHQRVSIDQLQTHKVDSGTHTHGNTTRNYSQTRKHFSEYSYQQNLYPVPSMRHVTIINHQHQYSTEL